MMARPSIAFAALVALAAGCASTRPVPADKVARTQAVIAAAEAMEAGAAPRAAAHLHLAKQQLGRAKALMQTGDNAAASLVLLRAEADGEVALNLAREHWARTDAESTIASVRHALAQLKGGEGS